jgi:hypothetical protein
VTDYSQNGWTAPGRSVIVTMTVPGTAVKLPVRAGPAGQLLVAAAARWHREVEPLVAGTCWGYADRTVRGSATDLSNHASGTAIDLNAPQHPLGTAPTANFTAAKIDAIHRIVAAYAPCLRWGGDYTGRKDGMHLEIVASERQCAAVLGSPQPTPSPTPRPTEDDLPSPADVWNFKIADPFVSNADPTYLKPAADLVGWAATHAAYARAGADAANKAVAALEQRIDQLAAGSAGPAVSTGPAVLTDADVDRIAAAVVKLLGAKASA